MKRLPILELYNLIKINPSSEIWLKSTKVRMRMLKILMNNIKISLKNNGIVFHKYQLSRDSTRIFFFLDNKDIKIATKKLRKVIGIYSINPSLRTSNKIKNIIEKLISVGNEVLQKEDTFALRVKRSGKHDYTSQDIAVQGGQAIIDNFADLNLKVNLSNPMKKIFVEVRDEFSYIYTDIIMTKWGGMPIEKNKKVIVSDIGRLNDLLAGFLLMRRGSEIYPVLFRLTEKKDFIQSYIKNWKELIDYSHPFNLKVRIIDFTKIIQYLEKKLDEKQYICAICRLARFEALSIILKQVNFKNFDRIRAITDGISLNDASDCPDKVELMTISLNYLFSIYPIFTPIIGLGLNETNQFLSKLSKNLINLDYCKFKPKNQEIDLEKLENIYKNLNLKDLIINCLKNIDEFNIVQGYANTD